MFRPKMRLGDILLQEGLITDVQLKQALDEQKLNPSKPLGELLVQMGAISEETLVEFLGKQFNIPYISNQDELLVPERNFLVEEFVTEEFMRQNQVLPLGRKGNLLKVALYDPLDLLLMDNLKVMTGLEIAPVIVGKQMLSKAIDHYFERSSQVQEKKAEESEDVSNLEKIMAEAAEGQVVRIVNLIIMQAVSDGASDIHFEPSENSGFQIRYRIDGELQFVSPPPAKLYLAVISRVKILARLDIAEKRLPQDGSITMKIEERDIDLRVSSIPTIYGEKVVVRILDKGKLPLDIEKLGIDEQSLVHFKEALNRPYGMMLLTGPTGSGKTTTLYACLNEINQPNRNINTIEDPVEYRLKGVNQIQVRPEIGLDFAHGLRSFLRQDPDIIMVGEIRDGETAEIAVRAALTGHFVLSTLHTNTAVQALDRLMNIGVDPVLITSSLLLVVAQRLVRRLCSDCKEAYLPTEHMQEKYGLDPQEQIFRKVGCERCKNSGYRGRIPIHECFVMSDDIKDMIANNAPTHQLEEKAQEQGMKTLRSSGLDKVRAGLTSIEEIVAITV